VCSESAFAVENCVVSNELVFVAEIVLSAASQFLLLVCSESVFAAELQ